MENFTVVYKHFNHCLVNDDILGLDDSLDLGQKLQEFDDLKQVILKDLERVYYARIKDAKDNSELKREILYLLEIYREPMEGNFNFISLTDHYLSFNNYELVATEEDVWRYIDQALPYVSCVETKYIISRDFKNFYIGRTIYNTEYEHTHSTFSRFSFKDNRIHSSFTSLDSPIDFFPYDDNKIQNFLEQTMDYGYQYKK